eukprot:CAMPEP_0180525324 /NCGR_PEP_ID=MMETSP1036_2-20121128/59104_1 /TAXON_ID=632150 /ORGANISM="Azadinium spinosum, Strain 3D9" /LENGTH=40 /DNA_ID= /DNA_START= /DNA_END= /DNA_ORIENTATION=
MVESILASAKSDRWTVVRTETANKKEFLHNMLTIYKAVDT